GLDAGTWAAWMEAVHYGDEDIHVRMPKFELAYGEDLSDALKAMGMEVAFDRSRQNFPRMTPMPRSWIDRVKQK
ncbi:MAG: serpin family protein, partial [Gammaproteobacteria bacterium]|nr:serpin family protein [Gemmatimonadota bacterium]NIU80593.1 serpin family protein [Gammaproteobacteria bacterium]